MKSAPPGNESELLDHLTRPGDALVEAVREIESPLIVVGAAGKMGPSLCVLARRAAERAGRNLEVTAVSRFRDRARKRWLESAGIRTEEADLLTRSALDALPDSVNVVFLVGLKFGTSRAPWLTWATNTLAPAHVSERYPRAKMVALSTGNVYPNSSVARGGSVESDPLTPSGEYANAAVARERLFQFHSERNGTPIALLRLNYAVDLRYGVLVDIARKVLAGEPIDLTQGHLNCIWQGDANDRILRSFQLAAAPAESFNLTSPEIHSVRDIAFAFGVHFRREPRWIGAESDTALLSNAARMTEALGAPAMDLDTMIAWTADWIRNDRPTYGQATHFEVRDGAY